MLRLDVQHELLHRRLFMAVADDLEGLDHGDAGGHHGRELAAEYRDVLGLDLAAGPEQPLALRLDAGGGDALAAQIGTQGRLVGGKALPRTLLPRLSLPSQRNCVSRLGRGGC